MAKFLDKDGLQRFFTGLKNKFAAKDHTHTKSQITDFPSLGTVASRNVTSIISDTSDIPDASAVMTYVDESIPNDATTTEHGLMSASDKTKLDGIVTTTSIDTSNKLPTSNAVKTYVDDAITNAIGTAMEGSY